MSIAYIYRSCSEVLASDAYAVLGVRHGASHREVRRAFRRLAAIYHPDANRGQHADVVDQLELLKSARDEIIKGIADPLAIALPEWAAGDGDHQALLILMYIGMMSVVALLALYTAWRFNGTTGLQVQRTSIARRRAVQNHFVEEIHDFDQIDDDIDDESIDTDGA